ncbi:MAG: ROK family protein [Actinomycetes bacterium]
MTVLARGSRGARTEDVRRGNLGTLLRHVHVHGPTSRSRLTSLLALNRSTIGDLTGELVGAGLVREEPGGRTNALAAGGSGTGGRPSYVVVPQTQRVQVLAVDIGVTHLTVARVGLGGHVLSRRDISHGRGPRRPRDVVRAIGTVARELLAEMGPNTCCTGAGAAVPGMVRVPDGLIRQVPNLGWNDVPLGEELAGELAMPVAVGNDADLGVLAEHVRGAAVECDDVVYLAGHSGIGAGVFTSGRPLVGRRGYAGEVGHLVVNPGGLPCRCGSRGCWETEAGEERLFELAGRPAGGGLASVREVVAAAAEGDASAVAGVQHVACWLGRGTANVVNVFNPEVVIMGGALAEIYAAAEATVRDSVAAQGLAPPLEGLRLVPPAFGLDSSLVGAAELAFGPLLSDPLLEMSRLTAS